MQNKHIITIITTSIEVAKWPFNGLEEPIYKTENIYLFPTLTENPSKLALIILNQFCGENGFITHVRDEPTQDNHLILIATDGKGNVALYTVYN